MIQLFTKPGCPPCKGTQKALDKAGVPYEKFDITEDPEARARVEALGYLSAPVVVVNADTHWSGFRPDRIAELGD